MATKLVLVFVLFFLTLATGFSQYLKLNSNPQNPGKMPDPAREYGVILDRDSPILTIGGGSGKISRGKLPAGTLVIASKETHNADWVAICGNDNLTPWIPTGKVVYFKGKEDYRFACEDMLARLIKLQDGVDELQNGVDILLSRDYAGTLIELRQMIKNLQAPPKSESEKYSMDFGWTNSKTIAVPIGTTLGFLAGGYLFQDKEIEKSIRIIPGVKFQTGDGTIQQTPDRMEVTENVTNKFSWKNATIGALAGLLSSYLIFSF